MKLQIIVDIGNGQHIAAHLDLPNSVGGFEEEIIFVHAHDLPDVQNALCELSSNASAMMREVKRSERDRDFMAGFEPGR